MPKPVDLTQLRAIRPKRATAIPVFETGQRIPQTITPKRFSVESEAALAFPLVQSRSVSLLDTIQADYDLMYVIERWPDVPQVVRTGIVAMIRASDIENRD